MRSSYEGRLAERYRIEEAGADVRLLEQIACARGCKLKGDLPDYQKAAALVIEDFRSGRLGRVTLEWPESTEKE